MRAAVQLPRFLQVGTRQLHIGDVIGDFSARVRTRRVLLRLRTTARLEWWLRRDNHIQKGTVELVVQFITAVFKSTECEYRSLSVCYVYTRAPLGPMPDVQLNTSPCTEAAPELPHRKYKERRHP